MSLSEWVYVCKYDWVKVQCEEVKLCAYFHKRTNKLKSHTRIYSIYVCVCCKKCYRSIKEHTVFYAWKSTPAYPTISIRRKQKLVIKCRKRKHGLWLSRCVLYGEWDECLWEKVVFSTLLKIYKFCANRNIYVPYGNFTDKGLSGAYVGFGIKESQRKAGMNLNEFLSFEKYKCTYLMLFV